MSDGDAGEELAYRVVSAARRRRLRRLVVAALVVVTLGGGVAVALTHRSGADTSGPATAVHRPGAAADRAAIVALARAHLAKPGSNRHVVLGALVVRGDHARLQVSVACGPVCGKGEELTFARTSGHVWRITRVRQTWIS